MTPELLLRSLPDYDKGDQPCEDFYPVYIDGEIERVQCEKCCSGFIMDCAKCGKKHHKLGSQTCCDGKHDPFEDHVFFNNRYLVNVHGTKEKREVDPADINISEIRTDYTPPKERTL